MLERRTRLGRYEVMDELGIGAMATVYKARNTEDGSPVAIKVPDRRLLSNVRALQQFKREGQALIRLRHPNIVRVHSVGQQNDIPYIVMDYVEGHTLSQELQHRGKFSPEEAIEFLLPIADALDYSHTEKTVHCDVKPGNVRLYRGRVPVLVDFGIAQTIDGTVWDEGKPVGSVWYMSPEQARGERASDRSDQYALAIVAYEMLAGKVPFDGDNPFAIVLQQRDANPRVPQEWDLALQEVMQRALDKDPARRFSSCLEFVRALQKAARESAPSGFHSTAGASHDTIWTREPGSTTAVWTERQAGPGSSGYRNSPVSQNEKQVGPVTLSRNGGQKQKSERLATTQRKAIVAAGAMFCFFVVGLMATILLVRHHAKAGLAKIVTIETSKPAPPLPISKLNGRSDAPGKSEVSLKPQALSSIATDQAKAISANGRTKVGEDKARYPKTQEQSAEEIARMQAELEKAQAETKLAKAQAEAAKAEAEAAAAKTRLEEAAKAQAANNKVMTNESRSGPPSAASFSTPVNGLTSKSQGPAAYAAPSPAVSSGSNVPAQLIKKTDPKYPQNASNRSMSIGVVTVKVTIDADGKVSNPKYVSGSLFFADAAMACVKQWQFAPAMRNGQPVSSEQNITVTFAHQ